MSSPIEQFEDPFAQLELSPPLLQALREIGYELPSPIQAACIPHLLAGHDLIGQAQTGTGKTAAFALPLLQHLNLNERHPQVLVLTPTRELAIQVSEAFQNYARHLPGFHVLPIYGGQSMTLQLRHLKRGAHVIVGTPGRIIDHLRRETLVLDGLHSVVLDEADEMLRMGFIDDVDWILGRTPPERQIALFSATMPEQIRRVAHRHLRDPQEVKIQARTATVAAVDQRYWQVSGLHKLDALNRILEVEDMDAALVFVRTKTAATELAERLEARGYPCAALHGDMTQTLRERTVEQLKNNTIDIVVATDVAARGLDVQRISHVVNYDIPYDAEAYIHRIGRTGRAGRGGTAILFVAPREMRMLRMIEKATRQPISPMQPPSQAAIAGHRIQRFKQKVRDTLAAQELSFFHEVIHQIEEEQDISASDVAAALAYLIQKERPLQALEVSHIKIPDAYVEDDSRSSRGAGQRQGQGRAPRDRDRGDRSERGGRESSGDMTRYRLDVGLQHGATPQNIVGAIANEAGLQSRDIGRIEIFDDHSTVDLSSSLSNDVLQQLRKVRVRQCPINLTQAGQSEPSRPRRRPPADSARDGAVGNNSERAPRARRVVAAPRESRLSLRHKEESIP